MLTSLLAGLGSLFALFALVVLSHALQLGVLVMGLAMAAGLAMLLRGTRRGRARTPVAVPLPESERLAVALAEEPSERVPAPRSSRQPSHR